MKLKKTKGTHVTAKISSAPPSECSSDQRHYREFIDQDGQEVYYISKKWIKKGWTGQAYKIPKSLRHQVRHLILFHDASRGWTESTYMSDIVMSEYIHADAMTLAKLTT